MGESAQQAYSDNAESVAKIDNSKRHDHCGEHPAAKCKEKDGIKKGS